MRSLDHRTIPSFRNVFTPSFLSRLGERDEPPAAGEADVAGPWRVEGGSGGFGVFRAGKSAARGFRPYGVFASRPLALLAAALLPGTGNGCGESTAQHQIHRIGSFQYGEVRGFTALSLDGPRWKDLCRAVPGFAALERSSPRRKRIHRVGSFQCGALSRLTALSLD